MSSLRLGPWLSCVVRHRTLCREHFELILRVNEFPEARPGQFVQILCRASGEISGAALGAFLRRPFSIGGLHRAGDAVDLQFIGRVVGPGTAWLDQRREGDVVDLLGPFGSTFTLPPSDTQVILVAGGVGLPPIRWWCEILNNHGISCEAVYGAQSRDLLAVTINAMPSREGHAALCVDEFACANTPAAISTDDGSCGLRGRVTDILARRLEAPRADRAVWVYTCGPEPMLEAVARLCERHGATCEAALERVMGCGMGTCQSCVVAVRDVTRAEGRRYALCCREGPVFDASRVIW